MTIKTDALLCGRTHQWRMGSFLLASLLGVIFYGASPEAFGEETPIRRGAKIMKAEFTETDAPTLTIPDGWRLLEGEEWTGVNIREYYFTLESTQNGENPSNPTVRVDWTGVAAGNVLGGENVRRDGDSLTFEVTSREAPTKIFTELPHFGAVAVGVFHNFPGMQAGAYRDIPYPRCEISAQLNFIFAARIMMADAGFTASADTFDGVINLYGFETNFPHGHLDYPPHFHIMSVWDDWKEIQAAHFLLTEKGKVLTNNHYVVENGEENPAKSREYRSGEEVAFTDKSGAVRFYLAGLSDGSGITMRLADSSKEYRLSSGDGSYSVTCFMRESASSPWEPLATVHAVDNVITGTLTVKTDRNGEVTTEVWRYNPENGALQTE